MRLRNYTSLSDVTDFLSKSCIRVDYKDVANGPLEDANDENMCDFDDIEDVFADHLLMGRRLRKSLYAGNLSNLEEPPDHPPIALTGLALEFFTKAVPNDGLDILDMDYVSYASEAARVSPCAMIVAMIYLERLQLKKSEYLEVVSPSGLFVVTMLVASKFLFEDEEDIVTNQMWADALNFDVKELNILEKDFLAAIDWKILVDSDDYFNYLLKIEKIIATRQSSLRNWLSYNDICSMTHEKAFETFWAPCFMRIMKTMVLCTVGYVATALTIHNASSALCKSITEKHEVKSLSDVNATTSISYYTQNVAIHYNDNLSFIHGKSFKIHQSAEIPNQESNQNMVQKLKNNVCNKSTSKIISLDSSINKFHYILDKLKINLNLYTTHALTLTNYSFGYHESYCQQNVGCFALLM